MTGKYRNSLVDFVPGEQNKNLAMHEFKATLKGVNKNQLENMSMKATSRVLELKKKREESIANISNIASELD